MSAAFSAASTVAAVVVSLTSHIFFAAGCQTVAAFATGFLLGRLCCSLFFCHVFATGIPTGIRLVRS